MLLGITTAAVTTRVREGYAIDPARVEAAITERTEAIRAPPPREPTGVVLSHDELVEMVGICRRHGLFFICDEVCEFVDEPHGRSPLAARGAGIGGARDRGRFRLQAVQRLRGPARLPRDKNPEVRRAALHFGQAGCRARHRRPARGDGRPRHPRLTPTRSSRITGRVATCWWRDSPPSGCVPAPKGAFYIAVPLPVEGAEHFRAVAGPGLRARWRTVAWHPRGFYSTPGLGRNEVRLAYVLDRERLSRCVEIISTGLERYMVRSRTADDTGRIQQRQQRSQRKR